MAQREVLHFAHANGFPSGTYGKLLRILENEYDVIAIEKFGHDPRYPVDENWSNLVKELINFIESNSSEPIIGVGHSMGGVLTFLAAYQRP
ncbi:MAG: alpha/beta hydrolase [Chloroflexi bacterium]|nr:alpha/beta hydrolase [Chloroflexota bacterium]